MVSVTHVFRLGHHVMVDLCVLCVTNLNWICRYEKLQRARPSHVVNLASWSGGGGGESHQRPLWGAGADLTDGFGRWAYQKLGWLSLALLWHVCETCMIRVCATKKPSINVGGVSAKGQCMEYDSLSSCDLSRVHSAEGKRRDQPCKNVLSNVTEIISDCDGNPADTQNWAHVTILSCPWCDLFIQSHCEYDGIVVILNIYFCLWLRKRSKSCCKLMNFYILLFDTDTVHSILNCALKGLRRCQHIMTSMQPNNNSIKLKFISLYKNIIRSIMWVELR